LNPSLFNLGIDSLIRNIRENYQECGYNYDWQLRKVIQAYADDLLVYIDTREDMNTGLDGLEDLMKYAHINFNLKIFNLWIHNPEKETIRSVKLPNEKGERQDVGICSMKDTFKYLGVTLGARKLQKINSTNAE
jgi:hypothetical protein